MDPLAITDLLGEPADRGAAHLVLDRLALVEEAWDAWRAEPTEERLHRVRTASRRTRSLLRAYRGWLGDRGAGPLRRGLRAVMRATSPVRDLDVQLAWLDRAIEGAPPEAQPGLAWFRGRLAKRRQRLADAGADRMPDLARVLSRARGRLEAPGQPPLGLPEFGLVVAAAFRSHSDELAADLAGVLTPADQVRAHRARVHGKRLRYLLEPMAEALEGGPEALARLNAMQDDLGEFHDAQVLGEVVTAALRRAAPDAMDGIKWLADQLAERERAAWTIISDRWLGSRTDPVIVAMRTLAASLEGGADDSLPIEIERKYLLSTVPPAVLQAPSVEMRQGYLPGRVITERLREVRDGETLRRYRTVKAGRGVARIELEEPVDEALFDALWPLTEGRRLEKRRHRVPDGDLTWEVDIFTDREGLVLAEVELPSESVEPALPFWLRPFVLREVTGDPAYLNSTLAR